MIRRKLFALPFIGAAIAKMAGACTKDEKTGITTCAAAPVLEYKGGYSITVAEPSGRRRLTTYDANGGKVSEVYLEGLPQGTVITPAGTMWGEPLKNGQCPVCRTQNDPVERFVAIDKFKILVCCKGFEGHPCNNAFFQISE